MPWIRYNTTSNKCPVCNGKRKDCRENTETHIVHCRDLTAAPVGWKFLKQDSLGFGMWAIDDGKDDWRDNLDRIIAEQKQRKKAVGKPPGIRHGVYRALLESMDLSEDHARLLAHRQYSEVLVKVARSAQKWQRIDIEGEAPGFRSKRLNNGGEGIIFPVPNVDKQIVALRIYNPEDESGKYKWVSSGDDDPLHLPSGELPIGVFYPRAKSTRKVYVCEGVEIKPRIIAEMLGAVVIGVPGASMFGRFPKQMESTLAKLKPSEVIIVPDAGAIHNPTIRPAIDSFFAQMSKLGYITKALWWGQLDKSELDADELPPETLRQSQEIDRKELFAYSNPAESVISKLTKFALRLWRSTPITTIKNGGKTQTRLAAKDKYEGEIVEFAKGDGARIYQEAGRLGYKYILDCSPTGAGKTYTVGNLNPKSFFVFEDEEDDSFKRLIYFSQSPRNPNSAVIEEDFFEMPTRNNGFLLNYDKLTPAGSPTRTQLEDPDTEPELRTKATCHLTDLFLDCYAKGHDPKGICGGCEHFQQCRKERGDGYGYLSMTKSIKAQDKIHAHLRGMPEKLLDDNVVAIVDESEMAEWTAQREVREKDVRVVFKKLKEANKDLYRRLLAVKDLLLELYDEDSFPAPRWGWKMADIVAKFEDADLQGLDEYLEQIRVFEQESRPAITDLLEGKAELHQNFLYELVAILTRRKHGSLSAGNNVLTITTKNQRMVESLKDCHCVVFQDATHSREQLAIAMGIDQSEILVIRQEAGKLDNLTVKQYVGCGKLGNQRSQDEVERAGKIRQYFSEKYPDLGVIEFKAHSQPGDLIHGGDSRGSNAFQHKSDVLSLGLYRPNMGAALNEYQALTGSICDFEDEGFRRYYSHKIAATVQQEMGRLRANRRPGEQPTHHVVAEGDLSFLEELGLKLEVIDMGTIDPDLCTIENRIQSRNQTAAIAWVKEFGEEEWLKLRQKQFAYTLGITPSALCQWCKKYLGSFQRFKEMILAIMKPAPTPDEQLTEDDKAEVQILTDELIPALSELPLSNREFSEGIRDYIAPFHWKNVLEAINRLPISKSLRLLFRILRICKGEAHATG